MESEARSIAATTGTDRDAGGARGRDRARPGMLGQVISAIGRAGGVIGVSRSPRATCCATPP
jgi:hypothetical protein